MKIFEIGQTYYTRSIGDHNCIIHVTIKARTAKTVTANVMGTEKRFRVSEWDGAECFKPWGSYSMAPTITANDTEVLRPDWKKEPEDGEECDCGDPWCEDTRSGAEWVAPTTIAEKPGAYQITGAGTLDMTPAVCASIEELLPKRQRPADEVARALSMALDKAERWHGWRGDAQSVQAVWASE